MDNINVSALERAVERSAKMMATQMRERDEAIVKLAGVGVSISRIAELAGLTHGRVSQIVKRQRGREAANGGA